MAITLPYRFDTSGVWRIILKGVFGLNALLLFCILSALLIGHWGAALGLAISEAMVVAFTRVCMRFQQGSAGTLTADRVVIEPNVVLGLPMPGPRGVYTLDRFSAIRIEFRMGPIRPEVQGGPNEVVWLVGKAGTPDIALARTGNEAGRAVGREFGALLNLPVEEVGAPRVIRL